MVDTSVPDGSFPLPALTLKRSGGVLDEAIAIIRNDRAALYGQPGRVFSPEEMASLCRKTFSDFSRTRDSVSFPQENFAR